VCFEQTKTFFKNSELSVVPYPIRFDASKKQYSHARICESLGLNPTKKTIFISGGSQGSLFINRLIKQWIELNPHTHSLIQIIHQKDNALAMKQKHPALFTIIKETEIIKDNTNFFSVINRLIHQSTRIPLSSIEKGLET